MTIGRVSLGFAWVGFLAGILGYLLMGALPMGQRAGGPGQAHAAHVAHVHQASNAHGAHAHHHHGPTTAGNEQGPQSPSDRCTDACCGTFCHALAGPLSVIAGLIEAPLARPRPVSDRLASGDRPLRIDRPPRA